MLTRVKFSVTHTRLAPEERHKIEETLEKEITGLRCIGGGTLLIGEGSSDSSYELTTSKSDFLSFVEKIRKFYINLGYSPEIKFDNALRESFDDRTSQ